MRNIEPVSHGFLALHTVPFPIFRCKTSVSACLTRSGVLTRCTDDSAPTDIAEVISNGSNGRHVEQDCLIKTQEGPSELPAA